MVEINRLKVQKFPEISDVESLDGVPSRLLIEFEGYDSDDELYEVIDFETEVDDNELDRISNNSEDSYSSIAIATDFESLTKFKDVLDRISSSFRQFMRERVESMERNIFRINNGAPLEVPNLQDIPLDVRMVAYLLAQGDNRNVEELLRTVHQNVVVNVNLSYYFKIMLVMLTFNTLLLFKWMVWDRLEGLS
ncbi:hypothetical protein NQ318_004855 [Aromia moschata]|uniref:Uncharacterized protein n=1 Tax=Aromia moschata TaxID=1265417 RepID=A0AAV8Z2M9_9CUCU|nr:hypothetical protein NQ318_004855 [Aromia moschata]